MGPNGAALPPRPSDHFSDNEACSAGVGRTDIPIALGPTFQTRNRWTFAWLPGRMSLPRHRWGRAQPTTLQDQEVGAHRCGRDSRSPLPRATEEAAAPPPESAPHLHHAGFSAARALSPFPASHMIPRESAGGRGRPRALPLGRAMPLPHPLTTGCCGGPLAKQLGVGSGLTPCPWEGHRPYPTRSP